MTFNYTPNSNPPPPGATFTWSRAAVPGITEPASSGTGSVSEVLTNTTPLPVTVTYIYTVTANGCTNPNTFNVQVVVRPIPVLTSNLNPPGICSGNIFSYTPTSSTPGTTYSWVRYTIPEINEPGTTGLGNINEILTSNVAVPVTVSYFYTLSAAGCTNPTIYEVQVVVSPSPVLISDPTPPDICSGTVFSYTPASNVGGTTFEWSRASVIGISEFGTTGTDNISEVLTNTTALPIPVTYVYTLTADGCVNPTVFNVVVVVNPTPLLSSSLTPPAICSGTLFSYTPTSNTPGTTFAWSRAVVAGISNPAATGTDNPNEILINTTNVTVNVTYVYTLSANGCTHVQNVVVGVKPTPTVNPIADKFYCNGFAVPVTPVTGPVAGTSFAWTNSNTAIGLGASGTGNIPAFTATNPGDDPITATITITPSASGCTGPVFSYIITVYPSPVMTSDLTPPDICSGTEFDYEPESNVDGAIFTWSRAAVAGISNPAASGSGNPHETLINTTVNPVNVTYVYTLSANGCNSPTPYNVVVIVNPTPTLTSTLNPQAICSNTLFSYNPTSGTAGTVFNWTRPAVAGISNPAASGTGNPMEVLINTTTSPIPVIYIYTLTANNCANVQNVTVIVKPSPTVDPVADQEYCNGDAVPETILTGPVTGTTFAWTNNNPSIGLGASGTGNVPAFTATNITPAPLVATITIIPTAASCTGTPETYTITVYPAATVNPVANQLYCNGDAAPLTVVTGPISGTTFTWTNSDPSIGLPASGTGDVPAFTATNISTVPVVATITITPFYGTCDGIPSSYTITVDPTPTVNPVGNQIYCEGATVPQTVLTGTVTGTVFTWVNDNTGIGLAAGGTGNIPSFVATNSTPNPIIATITITPSANSCTGASTSYTITVNPTPELSSTLNPPGICSESQFYYEPTSTTSGVIFSWTRAAIAGISNPPASGTGVIDEELENTTFSPIAVTYEYTLTANGCTNVQNVVVIVSPIPTLTSGDPDPSTVCSNSPFTYTPSGPVAGTVFAWSRAAVAGISNPPASGTGSINEVLINTTPGAIAVTYVFTMSTPGCTNTEPVNIVVVVIPAPLVTATASESLVCEGELFNLSASSNLGPTLPPILLTEDFNSGTIGSNNGPNGWTSTGTNPRRWIIQNSPYNNGQVIINSNDALFYYADSRTGNTTTTLVSPLINIPTGYLSLQLNFRHYYRDNGTIAGDYARIDVWNGVMWQQITQYNSTIPAPGTFTNQTVSLNAYINTPTIQIRFRYNATSDRYWAIDNVSVTGTSPIPVATWTSIPAGFNYVGNNVTGVSQTVTTSYIATFTSASCPGRDTVTVEMAPVPAASITANYCAVPGMVVLTAHPSPPGHTYLWSNGATTQSIQVDEVGIYSVTVTNSFNCSATSFMQVSNELVTNGDFSLGNVGFTTSYGYVIDTPAPDELWPEGLYGVGPNAHSYHPLFWGYDHTTGSGTGNDNFMIVNGSPMNPQITVWQQIVPVLPNTDYYFSAWAMSVNNYPPYARLQFEVNGSQVGTIAELGEGPSQQSEVTLGNWVRFYSDPVWNSSAATTAVIRIINLQTEESGNDFGLDDISFGTMDPFPAGIDPEANGGSDLCEGDTLYLEANVEGGLPPINYYWTGPNGFISTLQNPVIPNVTILNAGWYILSVTDGYGCPANLDSTLLTIIPSPSATISPSENVCVNDPEPLVTFTGAEGVEPYTFFYTLNAGPEQSITTISGNTISISVPTNIPGTFVYVLTGVIDENGCLTTLNDTCIITVSELPECLITGDDLLCPNTTGNTYTGPVGMAGYSWSIAGNGIITGPADEPAVTVTSGPACNSPFTLTLTVSDDLSCDTTCSLAVLVQDINPPSWTTPAGDLDVTLQCSDVAGLANAQALAPAATDNCTSPLTPVKTAGAFVPGSCANAGTYTNTWTVADSCGNATATLFTQVITIIDNIAPVWTTLPGALDVTLDCGDLSGLAAAQALVPAATDNCDINLVVVKTAGDFVPGFCDQSGSYTNTFNVSDDCGNPGSIFTQVITVNDNSAPDITCPGNIAIDCDESIDPVNTGTAIATDDCDPDPVITYLDVTIPGGCPDSYTIQRTWTATDDCGNSINCLQVISVQDVSPPVLVGVPANTSVSCDAIPPPPVVTATDNCDLSVTVSFSEINNVINGCGTITRTWSATDDCNNTVTASQIITVFDNTLPVLTGVPDDLTVPCDAVPDPPVVTVTDNCDPTVTVIFEETINTVIGGCGEIIRTWSATDYCGNTVTDTQTITVEDAEAPVWLTAAGALNVTLQCNDASGLIIAQSLEPVPSDNCDPDLTPVKVAGPFIPGSCPQAGTYTNTWTVTDYCGNISEVYTQVITIIDNTAPGWDQAPNFLNRNLACNDVAGLAAALALAPTATDNCGTATVTMVSDVTVTGSCSGSYTRTRKWSASDGCNNTNAIQYTQIIIVSDNVAPVWDQVAGALDAEVACDDPDGLDAALALEPTATDECLSGVNIYLESDDIYTGACPGTYTRVRTWSASDDCGNINPVVYMQTILVADDEQPVFYNIPAGVTISCEDPLPPVPADIMAFDNCSFDVTADIVFTEDPLVPEPDCPDGGTITRTWTVDDGCGNTAIATQVITIYDNIAPVFSACPPDIVTMADEGFPYATVSLPDPEYSDNCSDDAGILLTWTMTPPTAGLGSGIIPDPFQFYTGTTTVTYTATDACGNASTCIFTVTVEPNDQPDITCPANISQPADPGLCSAALIPGFPTLVSGTPPIVYTWVMTGATTGSGTGAIVPDPFTFNVGTTTITWTATNIAGFDECTQTVIVIDNQLPTFTAPLPFSFCVEDIFTADYYDPTMDITPDRPEYYLFEAGETTFDLITATFADNCPLTCIVEIRWRISFADGSFLPPLPTLYIAGQPSVYPLDIQFPGSVTSDVVHAITYQIVDCNGNVSLPITVGITIKPRPDVIKQ
jgi:hypothetical protein